MRHHGRLVLNDFTGDRGPRRNLLLDTAEFALPASGSVLVSKSATLAGGLL